MSKAIVLSSGGVDSTTCVGYAIKQHGAENVSTVSCYYGQKHDKEIEAARAIAEYYGVDHYEFDLSEIFKYSNCALLKTSDQEIVHEDYATQTAKGKVNTYVPFRNGLMLSCAATLAMSIYPNDNIKIYLGAHADDAAGNAYADCSLVFTDTMRQAILHGTYNQVQVVAPFVNFNKAQVVKTGLRIGVPYELTWSCYEGDDVQCGTCGTCIDRRKAFEANGAVDPVPYAE